MKKITIIFLVLLAGVFVYSNFFPLTVGYIGRSCDAYNFAWGPGVLKECHCIGIKTQGGFAGPDSGGANACLGYPITTYEHPSWNNI